ncbi:MAG: hypothetical protein HZB11_01150 [Candidatus Yonathbacteria bacterium]|nr:hypothetical protein [Candidatus Yonathbacteria bacterium]
MKRFGTKWINAIEDLWDIAETIFDMPHIRVVPKGNERNIRKAHSVERAALCITEWK